MPLTKTLEERFLERLPHWLTTEGGWGEKWGAIIGRFLDAVSGDGGLFHEATRARFISRAPSDAIPYAASDAAVPRFIAGDTEGEIRARIADACGFHSRVGRDVGAQEVMEILGFDPAETFVVDISLGESWCHESGWWSSWYIVSRNPLEWTTTSDLWDASPLTWDEGAECWDFTCDPATFTQLGPFLWKYKWAHSFPLGVVTVFGDGELWDEGLWNGGTWDGDSDDWDEDQATTTVAAFPVSGLWDGDLRPNDETHDSTGTWDQEADSGATWASDSP